MDPSEHTRERGAGVSWGWVAIWCAFVAYAAWLAPPNDPVLIGRLLRGDVARVDPSIVAVFDILGVVPVLASGFVLRDGEGRKLPAWPFALGMFILGAFSLLPWLALRRLGGPAEHSRAPGRVRRWLASRVAAWGIVVALVGLTSWGLVAGSAAAYLAAFRTASLVHVMTIDLVVCACLLVVLAREGHGRESPLAALRWLPVLGVAIENAVLRRAADPLIDTR